jgi:23S rRNA pseudouridine1911/1915/1917 synthase
VNDAPIAWTVTAAEDVGERADVVLGRRVATLSRRAARALALGGALRCNGKRVPPSQRVALGDRLELAITPSVTMLETPRVLAVSDAFVYVAKPSGLHTHRLRPDQPAALADLVAALHPECALASPEPREGGALHRLDRGTSGVVAFARSRVAWDAGRAAITDARSVKLYAALCITEAAPSWPPRAGPELVPAPAPPLPADLPRPQAMAPLRLSLLLGRGASRDTVAVRADGRTTESIIVPLASAAVPDGGERVLVALRLLEGHRHQARVHLAWLGMPIEGDARYGPGPGALALHCSALDLSACCPGEQRVDAPVPPSLRARLDELGLRPWAQSLPA